MLALVGGGKDVDPAVGARLHSHIADSGQNEKKENKTERMGSSGVSNGGSVTLGREVQRQIPNKRAKPWK
jgi:hypothetical protein